MSDEVLQQGPVRVCLTRCPLSAPEQGVHSLPCHIQHNGTAAIKSYFRPEELQPTDDAKCDAKCDAASAKRPWRAEFRGVQLDGEKVSLSAIGMQGLLLEDAGMTHESDEGRVWEVDNHFNEMTVWVMPNGGDDDAAIPSTLAQWTQLAHALAMAPGRRSSRPALASRIHVECMAANPAWASLPPVGVIGSRFGPRVTSTGLEPRDQMSPVGIDADEVETYLAKPDVPVGDLSSSHQRQEKKRRRSVCSTDTDNNPMCVGQVHHNARALVVTSAAAPVILSQLSRCSVAKTLNRNPLVRNLGDEDDARSIRARVQQLLIHVVMLPVVWVSVCCVVTAAMGIGCVESLQSKLLILASAPTDARTGGDADTDTDDGNQRPTKKAKRSIRENDRDSSRQRLSRVHHRDENHHDEEDLLAIVQQKKMKKTDASEPVKTTDDANNKTCDPLLGAHVLANTQRAPRPRKRRVIIWDLDETLVLFASLCSGEFARTHGRDVATSVALGEQMMTYLLAVLERHFYFSDLHDADVDHITTARPPDNATEPMDLTSVAKGTPEYAAVVAEQYTHIRAIYDRHRAVDFLDDASSQWFAARHALVAAIDGFSAGWIKEAKEILTLTSAQRPAPTRAAGSPVTEDLEEQDEVINVMVTNTQLSPALCKCLIYGIDQFFPIDCVYSSTKLHKLRCFQTIIAKYSKDTTTSASADVVDRDVEFLAVGDGMEEEQVSQALGLSFFKIRSLHDLQQLRYELQLAPRPPSMAATSPKPFRTPSPATTTVAAE